MLIEKILVVAKKSRREELWNFYHQHFTPLNEKTPLAQSLDRQTFDIWMNSPRATKFIVRNSQNDLVGLAVVSGELRHDPLISIPFFKKKYPGKRIYHFPAVALSEELRSKPLSYRELILAMMAELPDKAIAVLFHSAGVNPAVPRLVRRACHPKVAVEVIDSMACVLCTWVGETPSKAPETF